MEAAAGEPAVKNHAAAIATSVGWEYLMVGNGQCPVFGAPAQAKGAETDGAEGVSFGETPCWTKDYVQAGLNASNPPNYPVPRPRDAPKCFAEHRR